MKFQAFTSNIVCLKQHLVGAEALTRTAYPNCLKLNQSRTGTVAKARKMSRYMTTRSLSSNQSTNSNAQHQENSSSINWTTNRLTKDQIAKVDTIFQKILWLDMFETSMVTELINERLGRVKLSPKQRKMLERQMDARVNERAMGGIDTSALADRSAETEAPPKQILVDMKLIGFDEKSKIKVIKEVRSIVDGLGLKEAKELVEGVPKTIHKGLKPEVAQEYKEKLEAAGAKIEIVPL